jgi:WS/DGAT/MGAT family acyltransferase
LNKKTIKEPMSKVDTAWLRMEQPSNLMMITGVIRFSEVLDAQRLREVVEQRFLVFPRFRQLAVDGATGANWIADPDFDLGQHIRLVALPGAAGPAELEELVSDLASTSLDHARPLWQFHLVEHYRGGSALVVRIHHCIADGIALVQVFLGLTDPSREAPPVADRPEAWARKRSREGAVFRRLLEPARDGFDFAVNLGQKVVGEGLAMLQQPARAGQYALETRDILAELLSALALPNDPRTRLKGRLGARKAVAWAEPLPLDEVKAVGKAFGCTVNDVLIACAAGALRHYLLSHGEAADALEDIRATVPVNLRPLEHALELGNHFGLVFLSLPLRCDNPLQRLYAVNAEMNRLKSSKQAAVTFGFLAALGHGPSALQKPVLEILSEKASAVLTNVPGPQQPLYLAGAELAEMMFWVPQNGTIGLGISILSYNGQVYFGIISDHRLLSDPHAVIERFTPEFEKLLYLGMMLPLNGRPATSEAQGLLEQALKGLDGQG